MIKFLKNESNSMSAKVKVPKIESKVEDGYKAMIPVNLDIDHLSEQLLKDKKSIQSVQPMRDGILYLISLLHRSNYWELNKTDGYRYLKTEYLINIIGRGKDKKRLSDIKKVLIDNGIIEIKNYRKHVRSTGYRLTKKYLVGEYIEHELSQNARQKIAKYTIKDEIDLGSDSQYKLLVDQFSTHSLSVDYESLLPYLILLGIKCYDKICKYRNYKDENLEALFNYFGRILYICEDIEQKNFILKASSKNRRFTSNLTSLNKIVRPFLLINGERIAEIDIKSSQPYILSCLLNEKFYSSNTSRFNIDLVFNDMTESIKNLDLINFSRQKKENTKLINGIYVTPMAEIELNNFSSNDFAGDFYQQVFNDAVLNHNDLVKKYKSLQKGRKYIKSQMMNYLFDRDERNHEKNPLHRLLSQIFPALTNYILEFKKIYTNTTFAYMLQRTEMYLMLQVAAAINSKSSKIPFYTIHDSILTTQSNMKKIKGIMFSTITSITEIPVGLKSQNLIPPIAIDDDVISDLMLKFNIQSEKKWNDYQSFITKLNVKKGIDLLITNKNELSELYERFELS